MSKIIDDVDVSGCEFYDNYECNCHISECWEPEDRSKMMCKQVDDCYYKQLQRVKQELQKYQDMAKKGLEEFKDVGGCWGCGLQLQLNQDTEDIKQLKAENDRLKEEIEIRDNLSEKFRKEALSWANIANEYQKDKTKLYLTLQEIKAIAEKCDLCDDCTGIDDCERYCGDSAEPCATRQMNNILEIINKAEEE